MSNYDRRRPQIICFAGDVWDGNPHSRHHLMQRFAEEWEVLFVEGVPMRGVATGDRYELRRIARKLAARSRLRTVMPHLHVLRPSPVPPMGALGRRAQVETLRASVRRAQRRLGMTGPAIVWFSLPVAAPLLGRLGESGTVFYYQDRYDEFSHVDAARLRAHIRLLAERCAVTVASARALADDLRGLGATPVVVPHGVDLARFSTPAPAPAALSSFPRPLLGCVGLIDDHLDVRAIRAIADSLDRGTVVLVGDANVSSTELDHRRIRVIPRQPYEDMPAYVQAFAACLVPFGVTQLTRGVNPIKLREYLAAGRPVVATRLPEIEPYGDVVELVDEAGDWPRAVQRVLAHTDDEAARAVRRARVAGESWDGIAAQIDALMRPQLGSR